MFISLVTCATVGAVLLLHSSRWGIGLSPDSVAYIGAARSLLSGVGFSLPAESGEFAPITHYPPLYSGMLAVVALLGTDLLDGASWLNAVVFGTNIFLSGILLFAFTASLRLSLLASFFTLTAFPLVQVHTMAWSESVFILFELLTMLVLLAYLKRPARSTLVLASALSGLAILSRYAGAALIVGGMLAILVLAEKARREKIADAMLFAGIGLLPALVWIARNWQTAGNVVDRTISFRAPSLEQISLFPEIVAAWYSLAWVFGLDGRALLCFALLASVFLLTYSFLRKSHLADKLQANAASILMVLFIIAYLGVLVISQAFLDAQIPIDSRTLSPAYVPFVILVIAVVARVACMPLTCTSTHLLVGAGLSVLLVAQVPVSVNWLNLNYQNGIGYAGRQWKASQTLGTLRRLASSSVIYSNAPDVLFTLLGRPSIMIPRKIHTDTNLPNEDYRSQMSELERKLKSDGALVVYLYGVHWRRYLPSAEELERTLDLNAIARENDGVIYQAG